MINKYYTIPYYANLSLLIISLIICVSTISVITNMMLLVIVRRIANQKRLSLSFKLIATMTLIDIIASTCNIIMYIIRFIMGYPAIYETKWYCNIFSSACIYLSSLSSIMITFVAAERYFRICLSQGINEKLAWGISIFFITVFGVAVMGNVFTNKFTPDPSYIYCLPYEPTWSLLEIIIGNVMFGFLTGCLFFCYISIFIKCYTMPTLGNNSHSRKVCFRALLFLNIYASAFLPVIIFSIWERLGDISNCPWFIFAMVPLGMTSINAINPILVLFLHSHIKKEVMLLLTSSRYQLKGHELT